MRIVEDTPSRLVMRDRTLWIFLILCAAAAALLVRYAVTGDKSLLIGAGLSLAFGLPFLRSTDLVFDKEQRICNLRRFDVFKVTRQSLPFSDLRDIRVEVEPMAGDSHVISCRFRLVTGSADIPLTIAYEPDMDRYNRMRDIVLDAVFSRSHRPTAIDPVQDLINRGQIVGAVALLRKRDGLDLTTARDRIREMQAAETAAQHGIGTR